MHFVQHLGLVIFDTPYGLKQAPWDQERPSDEDLEIMLQQVAAVNSSECTTVCLWTHEDHIGAYKKVLAKTAFSSDICIVAWYKKDQNVEGSSTRFTHAVEHFVVGRRLASDSSKNVTNLSKNPVERHNMITGPTKSKYLLDDQGKKVNIHEKPGYLASWMAQRFCRPGDWAIVIGAGAGGDVLGLIDSDINVVAIERDAVQIPHLTARLTTYDAKIQLTQMKEMKKVKSGSAKPTKEAVQAAGDSCPNCGTDQFSTEPMDCSICSSGICTACGLVDKDKVRVYCGPKCVQTGKLDPSFQKVLALYTPSKKRKASANEEIVAEVPDQGEDVPVQVEEAPIEDEIPVFVEAPPKKLKL